GCARSLHVGLVAIEPSQGRVGAGDGRRDGLLQLVRERGRQLSHDAHPIHMCEIGPQSLAILLGALAVLNVGSRAVPPKDTSLLIPQRIVSDQEPAILPVFSPYSRLDLNGGTIRERPLTDG